MHVIITLTALVALYAGALWIAEKRRASAGAMRRMHPQRTNVVAALATVVAVIAVNELAFRSGLSRELEDAGVSRAMICIVTSIASAAFEFITAYVREPGYIYEFAQNAAFSTLLGVALFDVRSVVLRIIYHGIWDVTTAAVRAQVKAE
jgi:membrane protease YdiL (CAAX protease family)